MMNTAEVIISIGINSSFVTFIEVVDDVEEGGMLERGCIVKHASIASDKATWPVVRNHNGGRNGVHGAIRQRSECHQDLT